MTDKHHTWNDGTPILANAPCGCTITDDTCNLCWIGRDYRKAVEEAYNLYRINKDAAVDETVKRSTRERFEAAKGWYMRHLETGERWVL